MPRHRYDTLRLWRHRQLALALACELRRPCCQAGPPPDLLARVFRTIYYEALGIYADSPYYLLP